MPTGKVEWKRTARNNWLGVFVLEHASLCDIHNGFTSHAHAAAAMHLQRCATKRPEANFIVSDCLNTVISRAPRVLARVSSRREAAAGGFPESLQAPVKPMH